MTQVDTTSSRIAVADDWRSLRPVAIHVTAEQYAAFEAMCDREPRYLPRLAATIASPSVLDTDGKQVGGNPTPG